jgi:hypothetical protein
MTLPNGVAISAMHQDTIGGEGEEVTASVTVAFRH